jgi:hypothetical protein
LGTEFIIGRSADAETRELIERAHAYLERSFLLRRAFASPIDFNSQLRGWLDMTNTRHRAPPNRSPVELISIDKQAMLPLPGVAPPSGWHLSTSVRSRPFLEFDSNTYSVHPAVTGRRVDLHANLTQIRVLCDGEVVAEHNRAWARNSVITDPVHTATGTIS